MAAEIAAGTEPASRLHPASMLFSIGSAARRFLIPAIVVLFASRGRMSEVWMAFLLVPAAARAAIHYFTYRYRLGPDGLRIREGVVTRNERHIPYDRIQNIDLVQNPLHRMFGVAEVRLETAGGDKPEAVIRVLSLAAVDRMRARVFAGRDGAATADRDEAESPVVVYRATPREVFWFGIVSNRGMVVVAAALGLASQLDPFERWIGPAIRERWTSVESLPAFRLASLLPFAVAALVGFWILLRVLSVVWAFVQLHDFRLTRRGDDLRAEYGLLTRVSKTIPRHRVQFLSVRETVIHRLLGRASIQVETAGGVEGGGEGSASSGKLWLAPIVRRDAVAAIVREALPGVDLDGVEWRRLSDRARRRWFKRWLFLVVPATVVPAVAWTPWCLVALAVLVPFAWFDARMQVRHLGWAVDGEAVFFASGWWTRQTSTTRVSKIQALGLDSSPFDRRAGMASLRVDTAGAGRLGHRIDVPFLDGQVATELLDRLAVAAGHTTFRW
jgi:putative membrane protein